MENSLEKCASLMWPRSSQAVTQSLWRTIRRSMESPDSCMSSRVCPAKQNRIYPKWL